MKSLFAILLGMFALNMVGCSSERDERDGVTFEAIILPTDTLLNLACENVGIADERCVLEDPENPFVTVPILEFDVNNPGAENKFELFNSIPPGPTGAKARFYFWATALAKSRQSGENQYYTAVALHELFDANQDPLIQEQALKAYRSVLDNFFGSVTFFSCCAFASGTGEEVSFPVRLNVLTADSLKRTARQGYRRLVPGDPILVLELLGGWGYTYVEGTPENNYDDGIVSVNTG